MGDYVGDGSYGHRNHYLRGQLSFLYLRWEARVGRQKRVPLKKATWMEHGCLTHFGLLLVLSSLSLSGFVRHLLELSLHHHQHFSLLFLFLFVLHRITCLAVIQA